MLFDCFVWAGEWEMLRWRVEELRPLAPIHVLVEATRTFSGHPRTLACPIINEPHATGTQCRYLSKWAGAPVWHVIVDSLPAEPVGTERMYDTEGIQRNAIAAALRDACASPTDYVMMSDADEIPRVGAVAEWLLARHPRRDWTGTFLQRCHYYRLDLVADLWTPWHGTRITTAANAQDIGGQALRLTRGNVFIPEGGWHYSWFGGPDAMLLKLGSWSHIEKNRAPMNTWAHMDRAFREGIDWDVDRNAPLQPRPLDRDSAPAWLLADATRYGRHTQPT